MLYDILRTAAVALDPEKPSRRFVKEYEFPVDKWLVLDLAYALGMDCNPELAEGKDTVTTAVDLFSPYPLLHGLLGVLEAHRDDEETRTVYLLSLVSALENFGDTKHSDQDTAYPDRWPVCTDVLGEIFETHETLHEKYCGNVDQLRQAFRCLHRVHNPELHMHSRYAAPGYKYEQYRKAYDSMMCSSTLVEVTQGLSEAEGAEKFALEVFAYPCDEGNSRMQQLRSVFTDPSVTALAKKYREELGSRDFSLMDALTDRSGSAAPDADHLRGMAAVLGHPRIMKVLKDHFTGLENPLPTRILFPLASVGMESMVIPPDWGDVDAYVEQQLGGLFGLIEVHYGSEKIGRMIDEIHSTAVQTGSMELLRNTPAVISNYEAREVGEALCSWIRYISDKAEAGPDFAQYAYEVADILSGYPAEAVKVYESVETVMIVSPQESTARGLLDIASKTKTAAEAAKLAELIKSAYSGTFREFETMIGDGVPRKDRDQRMGELVLEYVRAGM